MPLTKRAMLWIMVIVGNAVGGGVIFLFIKELGVPGLFIGAAFMWFVLWKDFPWDGLKRG